MMRRIIRTSEGTKTRNCLTKLFLNLYSSQNVIRSIIWRRMKCMQHITCMGYEKFLHSLSGDLKEQFHAAQIIWGTVHKLWFAFLSIRWRTFYGLILGTPRDNVQQIQKILNGVSNILPLAQNEINSEDETRIKEEVRRVQGAAEEYLNRVHELFIKYLQQQARKERKRCLIM